MLDAHDKAGEEKSMLAKLTGMEVDADVAGDATSGELDKELSTTALNLVIIDLDNLNNDLVENKFQNV